MTTIHLSLYDALKSVISIAVDVVVVDLNSNLLVMHSKDACVEDDLSKEFYRREVSAIGLRPEYPGKVVVYVTDKLIDSSMEYD